MLYLNCSLIIVLRSLSVYLTLTNVVFELYTANSPLTAFFHLTLTNVVFEYMKATLFGRLSTHLTLTNVVFEFSTK